MGAKRFRTLVVDRVQKSVDAKTEHWQFQKLSQFVDLVDLWLFVDLQISDVIDLKDIVLRFPYKEVMLPYKDMDKIFAK